MKKFLSVLAIFVFAICLSGCAKEDKKSILNKLDKKINNASGYKLEAQMELVNNEDSYKYDVTVSYKKKDNYRVSLRNKTNNHEQIILKNEEGVYVLTPSLNKSFKFQSKWPYNNSQSYLLQSVVNDMKSDSKLSMKKEKDNYVFKSKVNYKNNASLTHQVVVVDKNYTIKSVTVLDSDENVGIKVVFNSIDMKAKFKNNYFVLEENMQTITSNDEKVVELDEGSRVILTFAGDNSFMLVEQTAVKNDEMTVIPTSGDLDIFMDTIAIVDDSSITWSSAGVDYYLVSSDTSTMELMNVAKSISSLPISK